MTATTNKNRCPQDSSASGRRSGRGLRRLKLAAVRRTAPEVLLTAKTQRWTPEEVLRTLVEAEIAARDASNEANRLKAAAFPVLKTLEGFDVSASSIRRPPSITYQAWNGFAHNTIWRSSARPAPASHTPSSGSVTPPSMPVTRCATSPPPT